MNSPFDFADFQTAKMLKELGFKEDCIAFYEEDGEFKYNNGTKDFNNNWIAKNKDGIEYYSAPLCWDLKKWLWDKHKTHIEITHIITNYPIHDKLVFKTEIISHEKENKIVFTFHKRLEQIFISSIDAEIEGIKKAVEYLHSNK